MALLHSDIGGYTTVNTNPNVTVRIGNRSKSVYLSIIDKRIRFVRQDRELYMRWMETAAFSSTGLMRTHEGSVPVENLQPWSDERLARVFAYFTKTFTALEPYRRLLMIEHQRRGYPILRPLLLHYPHGNRAAIDMERLQYMLGPLVLVVPVTSPELRYLNQKIVDGKGEEEQDDVGDDSDEGYDERVNGDQDMHVPHNGRKIKASVLATMYEWSSTIASTAAQLVLAQARPSNADAVFHMDDDEERVAPSITRTLLRFLLGRRGDMDAKDSDLPQPHHGRPYLPPGTWIHVWSGQRFTVTNDRGLFLEANNSNHRLACPLGQPGVFIRDISESEMREMLVRGMAGEPVLGGEDWRYWLDGRVDGSASTEEDGSNGSDEIRDRDEGANALADPIAYAMRRCRRFRRGLTSFLTHIENVPFPGDSDGEI